MEHPTIHRWVEAHMNCCACNSTGRPDPSGVLSHVLLCGAATFLRSDGGRNRAAAVEASAARHWRTSVHEPAIHAAGLECELVRRCAASERDSHGDGQCGIRVMDASARQACFMHAGAVMSASARSLGPAGASLPAAGLTGTLSLARQPARDAGGKYSEALAQIEEANGCPRHSAPASQGLVRIAKADA